MKPRIGITIGDPAGIGPEIVLKALSRKSVLSANDIFIFGDKTYLFQVQKRIFPRAYLPRVRFVDFPVISRQVKFGVPTAQGGLASGLFIKAAIKSALRKDIDAVVTAPINKESFRMGGWGKKFTGHTEMFASLTGASSVALMLVYRTLRAVQVTSHLPLKKVPSALTTSRVYETIVLTHQGLLKMGIRRPKIAVCGLNPHAGDGGILGNEEKRIIQPAIQKSMRKGIAAKGPISADVVWPAVRDQLFDAGLAMYHDQGQIPIKLLSFQRTNRRSQVHGINVTLGLPIIRTSVAHGSAYEIAGKGKASEESLLDAISLAATMARRSST